MKLKNSILGSLFKHMHLFLLGILTVFTLIWSGCGIYSFSGANVEGKTIKINYIENNAGIVAPILSQTLSNKIRTKILNQTALTAVTKGDADYEIAGNITSYVVTVAELQKTDIASKNRLTIAVEIDFKNNITAKNNYTKTFSRFSEFTADKTLQSVETILIDEITEQLADDIFNQSFVNW